MASQHKPIEEKVLEWIQEQGYPLEMYVAKAFGDANYQLTQSHIYLDPETQKPREIDLVTYKNRQRSRDKSASGEHEEIEGATITVGCCVECKLSKQKPWVLFMSDSPFAGAFDFYPITTEIGSSFLRQVTHIPGIPKVYALNNLYQACGYGVTQAFTTGTDVPYQAIMSAIKSTVARVEEEYIIHPLYGQAIPIYFPVVVIDGQLLECALDDEGNAKIQEVDSGAVWWNVPIGQTSSCAIQIFTKPALGKLISWLDRVGEALASCNDELIKISDDIIEAHNYQQAASGK